jgi:hypothetical protein
VWEPAAAAGSARGIEPLRRRRRNTASAVLFDLLTRGEERVDLGTTSGRRRLDSPAPSVFFVMKPWTRDRAILAMLTAARMARQTVC